jgi:PKD repeat protein
MKTRTLLSGAMVLGVLILAAPQPRAQAIRYLPGFTNYVFGPNDDGTYPCTGMNAGTPADCVPTTVPIGFTLTFYGETFDQLYVNNNGNVTFDSSLATYTPFGLIGTSREIIAPYFGDVDTRVGNVVTFGNDSVDGHPAFGVDWFNVGYFAEETNKLNSFQLILIDRSDRNLGDFDIEFNYDQVQWETGDASGGEDGLGGSSAVVGYSNGSGLAGTYFQMTGSAIPGEFLDSNPGGLVHGYLNTNVPGRYIFPIVNLSNLVLNVERFSQYDTRWGSDTYDSSSFTIQQKGCALSCLAMALNYAGATTDPGALNTLLIKSNDFVGTAINWDAATRDASDGTLEFHPYRTSDAQFLSEALGNGFPVIVGVNTNADGAAKHFVFVIGYEDGQYVINDPGHADATNLDYYNNSFETRGYVSASTGDVSGFDVSVGTAADTLLVDSLGRRSGYEPATGEILQEIPQSVYFLDALENDDLTGADGTDIAHLVEIYQPLQGNYQCFLFGTVGGNYDLSLRSFSINGTAGTAVSAPGTATVGAVAFYAATLASGNVTPQTVTNQIPWTVSATNGALPFTVQFSAPSNDSSGLAITNWSWNFGDTLTSSSQNPTDTYVSEGIYYPTLKAINSTGATLVAYGPSIILPTMTFTASPTNGPTPLAVQFAGTNTDSVGNTVTNWQWTFGDGGSSTLQNPFYTYASGGVFAPSLVGTDTNGLIVSGVGPEINVIPAPPAVQQLTATSATGYVTLTWRAFTNVSYQYNIYRSQTTNALVRGGGLSPIATISLTSTNGQYQDAAGLPGVSYDYAVSVETNSVEGLLSPPAAGTNLVTWPAAVSADLGGVLHLCVAAQSGLPLTYQWLLNGQPLTDQGLVAGSQTPCLTVGGILSTGQFAVVVSSSQGSVTSPVAPLSVTAASVEFANATYDGLFYPLAGITPTNAGAFDLTLNEHGKFSGKVRYAAVTAAFAGQFDSSGHSVVTAKASGKNGASIPLYLQLDTTPGQERITGAITNGNSVAALYVYQAGKNTGGAQRFTLAMPGGSDSTKTPGGWSSFAASLSTRNSLSLAGTLADGTTFSQSAMLLAGGDFPLFAPLYKGKGLLLGWVAFTNQTAHSDLVMWVKPSGQANYSSGFTILTNLIGSAYTKPAADSNSLVLTNKSGVLRLQGAGVSVTTGITVAHNKAGFTNDVDHVAITFNPADGTFSGTFSPSDKVKLNGIVLQQQGEAVGSFVEKNQGGSVLIEQ